MAISFTPTKIARFVGALYGVALNSATYNAALQEIYARGFDAVANEVFAADFGTQTTTQVAQTVVNNLGLTGQANTDAVAYLEGQLNGAAANARGAIISNVLSLFATLTSDTVYGAAATAFEGRVANAQAYSLAASSVQHGAFADLSSGVVLNLTTGFDSLVGTSGDDTFYAYERSGNTLNSGDVLDGKGGTDILYADIVNGGNALAPRTAGIEHAIFRVQHTNTDSGDGNIGNSAEAIIDAERMNGVTYWENSGSRADLIIEDVRITDTQKTKDITIAMVDTDPGNVDFGVYFDQHSLRNSSSGTTTLTIKLMDTGAAGNAATAATPLLNNPYDQFKLGVNGSLYTIQLDKAAVAAADTYEALLAVFQTALAGTGITAALSGTFTITDPISNTSVTGQNIVLTGTEGIAITSPTGSGWYNTTGASVPPTSNIYTTYSNDATSTSELVTSTVILDNVGRGSTGGDLLIGGLSVGETSTSRGVERFEIEVRDSSKLQTINSTNNALREVTIKSGNTSLTDTTVSAYNRANFVTNEGDLTVNGNAKSSLGVDQGVTADNQTMDGANQGATAVHQGVNAAGFTDVRLIDASEFKGKLAFTAAITSDSIAKYINQSDYQADPAADVAGSGNVNFNVPGANFLYTGGNDNDTMTVSIDSAVAASRSTVVSGQSDFTFNIEGGAGNDAISVQVIPTAVTGSLQNWYNNQNLNNNITISGGEGADTIRKPGAGDTTIDAGAGNDVVFADNTGTVNYGLTGWTNNAQDKGVWVFNTAIQGGSSLAQQNLNDLRSDSNDIYNLYKAKLQVTFKGLTSSQITLSSADYKTTDLEINQAIKQAINTDAILSKMLIAKDGPGNTLVVESLIDGVMATTHLGVAITLPTAADLTSTEVTAITSAWGLANGTTAANIVTDMTDGTYTNTAASIAASLGGAGTGFTAKGSYATDMATNNAIDITGANSTTISDNFITPGTGDDLIVLGTTLGASKDLSSNDVVKYTAAFGNDVIVNFDGSGGAGADYLDFTGIGVKSTGAITADMGTALSTALTVAADGNIMIEDRVSLTTDVVATENDTADNVKELFAADGVLAAARTMVYVAVANTNVGYVYKVVDGTGANDLTVSELGTIDLADTNWNTLTAITDFVAPTVYADGPVVTGGLLDVATATALAPAAGTYSLSDTAANLAGAGAAILNNAVNLTATTAANVAQATTIDAATNTGANSYAVSDTIANADALNFTTGYTGNTGVTLTGSVGVQTVTGSANADTIDGGADADVIDGGAGNDTITGGADADNITLGAGNDTLVFDSVVGVDTIADYVVANDSIQLSIATFTALGAVGALTAAEFVSGAGVVAGADASDRIVYDTTTGNLYYDADGSGGGAAVQIATLTGAPALVVGEFSIIA